MLYCYTSDDGHTVERVFPVGKAPASIAESGVTYRRDYAAEVKQVEPEFKTYISRVPPRNSPMFKPNPNGRGVVVESRRQEREYAKSQGLEWE